VPTKRSPNLRRFVKPRIKYYAKKLRKNPTPAEIKLWEFLRKRPLGYVWRRQMIMRGYIVDFKCYRLKMVIEVDGPSHDKTKKYDEFRDKVIGDLNYTVVRVRNEEIYNSPKLVHRFISQKMISRRAELIRLKNFFSPSSTF
jgi:very-short-patch-repair endonuclease